MKKTCINLLLLLICTASFAQQKEKIAYIFSDAIENTLDSCISKIKKSNHTFQFYLLLGADSSLYSISIGYYTKIESKNIISWIKTTNRYAVVNKIWIPIIFDYDIKFSTRYPDKIGTFHKRDGEVSRVELLLHGFTLYFTRTGEIIRTTDY